MTQLLIYLWRSSTTAVMWQVRWKNSCAMLRLTGRRRHNFNLNARPDVKQLLIDEATYRRRRPVSRSMAHEFFHRTCHIHRGRRRPPRGK